MNISSIYILILETLAPPTTRPVQCEEERDVLCVKGEIIKQNVLLKFIHKLNITYQTASPN